MSEIFKKWVLVPEKEYQRLKFPSFHPISTEPGSTEPRLGTNLQNIAQINERLVKEYQKAGVKKGSQNQSNTSLNTTTATSGGTGLNASSSMDPSNARVHSDDLDGENNDDTVEGSAATTLDGGLDNSAEAIGEMGASASAPKISTPKTSTPKTSTPKAKSDSSFSVSDSSFTKIESGKTLLSKIIKYFDEKDQKRATELIKRIVVCKGVKVDLAYRKIVVGTHSVLYLDFVDFISLCLSRKKPVNDKQLSKFVAVLAKNGFPTHIITNTYVRKAINDAINSLGATTSPNISLDRSGSSAMAPRLKGKQSTTSKSVGWMESLNDLPND